LAKVESQRFELHQKLKKEKSTKEPISKEIPDKDLKLKHKIQMDALKLKHS
jgi:hypothetical protein